MRSKGNYSKRPMSRKPISVEGVLQGGPARSLNLDARPYLNCVAPMRAKVALVSLTLNFKTSVPT
jgi:hypothetical protein